MLPLFITGLLLSCSKGPDPDQKYINTGKAASNELMQSLKGALTKAVADSGIEGAIGVCSEKALILTAEIDARSDSITDIRRVSDRFRNPHNAPDATDREAIAWFLDYQAAHDSLAAYHIVKSGNDVRYYQPLVIQPLCLNCHGQTDKMEANVVERIHEIYPEDMAVGYAPGDLRGLVRVTLQK
jgi:hypothetical protein